MTKEIRSIHPEVRVINESKGIVEYIASDETLDSYREVIKADGWRFTHFQKNAPFLDSHDSWTIQKLLGQVIDYRVQGDKLVERVQWAVDVEENEMAKLGFKMTAKGYLRAVSVGFWPVKRATKWDQDPRQFNQLVADMQLQNVNCIFLEQEQIELSACVIGANPNALVKAYKDGAVNDEEIDFCAREWERQQVVARLANNFGNASSTATHSLDRRQECEAKDDGREAWLEKFQSMLKST